MARICGICPVSHLIASAKACDEILAVEPPPTGADLRRVLNLAQVVQSHALSFFHLSSPDLLFGFDAEASGRHLFGALGANPPLARARGRLRPATSAWPLSPQLAPPPSGPWPGTRHRCGASPRRRPASATSPRRSWA